MPQTYFKSGGSWVAANNIFAKVSGAWARIKTVWAKVNGQWVRAGGTVILNINGNTANWSMRAALSAAGYNPDAAPWQVEINVAPGVIVYSTSTGVYAMAIDTLPAGAKVRLNNQGTIVGCGGAGGNQKYTNAIGIVSTYPEGQPGGHGGAALGLWVTTEINNTGTIGGGGGGGGGGAASGKRTDVTNDGGCKCSTSYSYGGNGGNGQGVGAATAGGTRAGAGGGLGSAGVAGSSASVSSGGCCSGYTNSGGVGGAGGNGIHGAWAIVWIAQGWIPGGWA